MFVTYFLLLSSLGLVITTQAQNCSKPAGGDNMGLKGEDILLQTFPEGKKVTFACNVGYMTAGGFWSITCTAGAWTPLTLKCERWNCGNAGEVDNGNIDYPEGTQFGDKLVVTCNPGFHTVPKKGQILCGAKGWMDRLPECEVVTCDKPTEVANAVFSPDKESYDHREVVQYRCQNDYTLNGSSSISCSEHGTFVPAPTCFLVQCEDPNIANGHQVDGSRPPHGYRSTVTYECISGHVMEGGRTLTCGIDSQWSPGLPTCQRRNCGSAGEVDNGNVDYPEGTQFGDKLVVTCNTGFYMVPKDKGQILCGAQGWMDRLPVCEVVTCDPPPEVVNGVFSPVKESYDYREVVQYKCQNDYTLNGSSSISCLEHGTFGPAPTCVRKNCGSAGEVENGNVEYPEGTQFGDKLVVTCNTGFYMVPKDKGQILCGAQGWMDRLPECEVVRCEDPYIANGHQVDGSRPPHGYNSTVTYECKSGYVMEGGRTLICGIDSQWSPGLPTCQTQNCSKPAGGDNMSLKGEDILLQTFPEGKKVTFACNVGYVTAGGSSSITCIAGNWTTLKLKCERRNCGSAGEVDNGNVDYPEGTQFGDKLVVTCNTGFKMVPNKGQILCGAQGWMDRLPVCEVVTCDPPPVVANGAFSPNKESYDYREVVQYKCQNDYTLNGSSSISCSDDGTFGPAPTCVLVRCEDPNIANGHQVDGSRPPHGYRSTVTYGCKSGYVMEGGRTLICGIDSQWSPGLPRCQRRDCGSAGEVDNGNVSYPEGTQFGDKLVVTCNTGFKMVPNKGQILCGAQGWMDRLPVCEVVTCDPPPMVANGAFSPVKESYNYREVVQYKCHDGYTLNGSSSISCSEHGTFGPAPTCVRRNCGSAGEVDNGNVDYPEGTQFGDKLVVTCNTGFKMVPNKGQILCGAQGWMDRLPVCEVVTCDPPTEVANGGFSPVKESYDYREVVQYRCQSGYTLSGSSSISCSEQGTFGPAPTCVLVQCEDPNIANGHQVEGSRPPHGYRSTVTYECKSGYVMDGGPTLICGIDGQWSPGLPTCQTQDCSKPAGGDNMSLKGEDILLQTFPEGKQVTFACNVGYVAAGGSPSITCTAGAWTPLKLKCERRDCGFAGDVENGNVDYPEGTQFGDKLVVTCNTGYNMVPKKGHLLCGAQGWMDRLPVCEVVTCDPPPVVANGVFSPVKESYDYREVVQYKCQNDYTLNGSSSISCSEHGTFDPAPTCVLVRCEDPNIANGHQVDGSQPPHGYNSTVTYECKSGHVMEGGRTLTCGIDSQWSPGLPTCQNNHGPKLAIGLDDCLGD
ncbi:sushi, von Willebrand factor type A, EGF and pentraxin domain-containing protein 1-like [Perca flavescens]|uniref:sushi, von Willebrand factor type A, EGF and pentraxin domain-containing protein 1-like n=1 Tax=Perca flavescens TaxID=8167 RepID=UPI00106E3669|nr:sushi, von Willebrand factor type A, EGF and pentraxin domain-containing protein 1-like [Perca flavescens]